MHCEYYKYILLLHLTFIKLSEYNYNKLLDGEREFGISKQFVNDNNWFRTILMEVNFQNYQIVCVTVLYVANG